MPQRPLAYAAAAGAAVLLSALVHLRLRDATALATSPPRKPAQVTATVTPTSWQAETSDFGRVVESNATGTPAIEGARVDTQGYVITRGIVRDALGREPLANTRVAVGSLPWCLTPVRSHDDGSYELVCPGIASLRYRLRAELSGYQVWERELPGYLLEGTIDIDMVRPPMASATPSLTATPTTTSATPMPTTRTLWLPRCEAPEP